MVSFEELKTQFEKLHEEDCSFGSIFGFLEMAICAYQEMQGWDNEEESILNGHMISKKGKKEKKNKNLSSKKTTKKGKRKVKNRYNDRKQWKKEMQQRGEIKKWEIESGGGKKARFDKEGRDKAKGSYKEFKQDVVCFVYKQFFFRDKG